MGDMLITLNSVLDQWKLNIEQCVLDNAEGGAALALKTPLAGIPMAAAENYLALNYAEKWFNFFLTDGKNQLPNSSCNYSTGQEISLVFATHPFAIFGHFTFNKDIKLAGME